MSKFLKEMADEAAVRVASYKAEREILLKASARIQELDALIAEAESEHASISVRLPKDPPGKDKDELVVKGLL